MLIELGGLPGVGKSTIATSLARRTGAVHLRIDTIKQAMRNAGLNVAGPEGYLAARDVAEDNLRIGHSAIVDSVDPIAITRSYWHATAARLAMDLVEIEVISLAGAPSADAAGGPAGTAGGPVPRGAAGRVRCRRSRWHEGK